MKVTVLLLLMWVPALTCPGADWFVATNGSGDGSFSNPWFLQQAITNSAIKPGDTVWLRGGTYFPVATWPDWNVNILGWKPTIRGTTNAPITLRSYSNEWASIDRRWDLKNGQPACLCFRELEFYDSLKGHNLTNNMYPNGPWSQFGDGNTGSFQFVNCVIHDLDNCFGGGTSVRGCILWHIGWNGYEHVFYPLGSGQTCSGNIVGWQFNDVIEHSSSSSVCSSNIIFGGGSNVSDGSGRDVLFDGGGQLVFNCFYNRFDFIPSCGFYPQTLSYIGGTPLTVLSNIIVGPDPVHFNTSISNYFTLSFVGNTLYANNTRYTAPNINWYGDSAPATFDYNTFFSTAAVTFNNQNSYGTTFSAWRTLYPGFDVHSTANNAAVPPSRVVVFPNQDNPKRCHVAVYNFSHADNVNVSLAGVLSAGDSYRLISAQNYNAGPIKSGTYDGISISVPMTNLTTAPVLFGTNLNCSGQRILLPYPMSPEFGAFVVIGGSPPPPAPATDLRVLPPY